MPVLVTGGEHALGRACAVASLRTGGEVRMFVDDSEVAPESLDRLRAHGAKLARGSRDDEGLLETALEQVHTVVVASADVLADPAGILDDVATATSAALGAGVRRIVLVSHLGVDAPGANAWLKALAEVEEMVAEAPIESLVIRRSLTYGVDDALTWMLAEGAPGASPDATHAPIFLPDLAAAVTAADARDRGAVGHLVVPLAGPEWTSLGELVALLGGQVSSDAGDTLPGGDALPSHVVDLLSRDLTADRALPTAGTTLVAGTALVREREGWD